MPQSNSYKEFTNLNGVSVTSRIKQLIDREYNSRTPEMKISGTQDAIRILQDAAVISESDADSLIDRLLERVTK